MPKFSKLSKERLSTCDVRLQLIMNAAIRIFDFSVLEGHRGEADQNAAFERGVSKARFPDSNHNASPSLAVDIAPYPIDREDTERFVLLAGIVRAVAFQYGLEDQIRWGGDWDRDDRMSDESFRDYAHFEVTTKEN